MPVESTRGLGQGSAQVFDTSGLANQYAQQEETKAKAKYTAQKDLEKKIAELASDENDIWKEKYFYNRDNKAVHEKYNTEIKEWMKGKAHLIVDPSTPEYQEYQDRLNDFRYTLRMSQESKELAEPFMKDVGLNPDKYKPETIQYVNEFVSTPFAVFDPSKMKEINTTDLLADLDKKNAVFFDEVKNRPTNLGVYDVGDEYYGQGEKMFATEADRTNHLGNVFMSWKTSPKHEEKVYEMFGEKAEKEGRDVWDVAWESLYPKTEIDITDVSYGRKGGVGSKKPFDPNNIIEDVGIVMGTDKKKDLGWFKPYENILANKDVRIYQTEPMEATYTISKDVIDAGTGKPLGAGGTYKIDYANMINYNGKAYFGAVIKDAKSPDGKPIHKSVLIPADELQETTITNGYEYDNMKNAVLGKKVTTGSGSYNIKGQTYSLDQLKKMGYTEEQVAKYKTK